MQNFYFLARLCSLAGWIEHEQVWTGFAQVWKVLEYTGLSWQSPWKLNLPWKVFEKHSKALKNLWILPFTGAFNTVFGDLNQYKIVMPLFGAAYARFFLIFLSLHPCCNKLLTLAIIKFSNCRQVPDKFGISQSKPILCVLKEQGL